MEIMRSECMIGKFLFEIGGDSVSDHEANV